MKGQNKQQSKGGKYMNKNRNNDRKLVVFKTISKVIISVLAIFFAVGTVVTIAVPININIFQGTNSTSYNIDENANQSSVIDNTSTNVVNNSSYSLSADDEKNIIINEIYTLYKNKVTYLDPISSTYYPYGYISSDVAMKGFCERIFINNYLDSDADIDYNDIHFATELYNSNHETIQQSDCLFSSYFFMKEEEIEIIFGIEKKLISDRYCCKLTIYNEKTELDTIFIVFDII